MPRRSASPAAGERIEHLLDLIAGWAPATARRMFGGYGLFHAGLMFGLVIRDRLYFKTDAGNRGAYEAAGMPPFTYIRGARGLVALPYHEVPPGLYDDGEALAAWAAEAFAAALRIRRARPARRGRAGA